MNILNNIGDGYKRTTWAQRAAIIFAIIIGCAILGNILITVPNVVRPSMKEAASKASAIGVILVVFAFFFYPLLVLQYWREIIEEQRTRFFSDWATGRKEYMRRLSLAGGKIDSVRPILTEMSLDHPNFTYLYEKIIEENLRRQWQGSKPLTTDEESDYLRTLAQEKAKELVGDRTYNLTSYIVPVSFSIVGVAFGVFLLSLRFMFSTPKLNMFMGTTAIDFLTLEGGFIGAWTYSLFPLVQRFIKRDLPPRCFILHGLRFIVAPITALFVLFLQTEFTSFTWFTGSWVFVQSFAIGVAPRFFLSKLQRVVLEKMPLIGHVKKRKGAGDKMLHELEGITFDISQRLSEEGIENIQHMATADLNSLFENTKYTITTLRDWRAESILYLLTADSGSFRADAGDETVYDDLDNHGIRTIEDLITWENQLDQLCVLLRWDDDRKEAYKSFLSKVIERGKSMISRH